MKKDRAFWTAHIAAIKEEGIATSAYAKRHELALKSLYYWQRKVRLAAAPTAPTGVTATAGNAQATLKFTAPTVSTGYTMSGYTASCTATGKTTATATATATASPITVSSMTNGTKYSCSVKGTYTATSASSSSVTVVPVAAGTTPGTPTSVIATAGNASASIAFTAPTAVSGVTISSYTATCTSGSTSKTGTGTSSPITVSSLTNSTSYSCTVKATSSAGVSGTASTAVTVTPTTSTSSTVTYSTPSNFEILVTNSYTPSSTLAATTTVTNRSRYMISDTKPASSSANYLSIGDSTYNTGGYSVSSGTLSSTATYKDYLNKTIQFTLDSTDKTGTYYRLDSHLHPNNSLDVTSVSDYSSMKFRNNFGKADLTSSTSPGYITFSYDSSTGKLKAKRRYVYSYTCSSSGNTTSCPSSYNYTDFTTTYFLTYSSGAYSLTTTGTPFYLYVTPLTLGIPSFLNPESTSFTANSAYNFLTGKATVTAVEGTYTISGAGSISSCSTGDIYKNLNSTYKSQACYPGTNSTTRAVAVTQLAAIKSALAANNESLRYSTDVYLAFRDALLAHKLISDSIADGTPGQNLVPFVYFTNEYSTSGSTKSYHPMMVIVSYGNQSSPNGLKDVPKPPGACKCRSKREPRGGLRAS